MLGYTFDCQPYIGWKSKIEGKKILYNSTSSPLRDWEFLRDFCDNNRKEIIKNFIEVFFDLLDEKENK